MRRTVSWQAMRRLLPPRSLRYQLLSRSLIILSGLLILIGILQYVFMSQFLYRNTAAAVLGEVRALPSQAWNYFSGPSGGDSSDNPLFGLNVPITTVAFINQPIHHHTIHMLVLFQSANHGPVPRLARLAYQQALLSGGGLVYQTHRNANGSEDLIVLFPGIVNGVPGLLQVTTPAGQLQSVLAQQLWIYIILAACALAGGVLSFLPVLQKTLIPLSSLVETVRRINAGTLDERFAASPQAQTEVQMLSASFNDMLERLHTSFAAEREAKEKMRQFVADASHELRTPLTSIHGFLEVLLRGAATNPEQLKKSLRSLLGESQRMNKLVEDLILLARLDQEPELELEEQSLDSVVSELEPQLRLLAGNRTVTFEVQQPISARCNRDKLKQVLLNLFQNAVQHTDPEQGSIRVSLCRRVQGAVLSVCDNGPGVAPEHQDRLFERFYRIDPSRSRRDGGVGLGLAITKSIVESHGGTIRYAAAMEGGAAFHVWLPDAR